MPTIVNLPGPITNSLSFDIQAWKGESRIRKSLGRFATFYSGTAINSQTAAIQAESSWSLPETTLLFLITTQPLTLVWESQQLLVTRSILLDNPPPLPVVLHNFGAVDAHVEVMYTTGPVDAGYLGEQLLS